MRTSELNGRHAGRPKSWMSKGGIEACPEQHVAAFNPANENALKVAQINVSCYLSA